MSKEALSLDISRLVSRVVKGETIDVAERGAALAQQYPDVGMSGAMIGQAIERAAGMVGMIRSAPPPPKPPRAVPPPSVPAPAEPPKAAVEAVTVRALHTPRPAPPTALPVAALSIDDALAAAIDAEIGNLVSGHTAATAPQARTNGETRAARAAPARANGEARIQQPPPPVRANGEAPAQPPPPAPRQASAPREPARNEPAPGSIFSSFRRALFRT